MFICEFHILVYENFVYENFICGKVPIPHIISYMRFSYMKFNVKFT